MVCFEILSTYWWLYPLMALGIMLTMGILCFLMMRKGWCTMSPGGHESPMQDMIPKMMGKKKPEKK